MYRGPCIIKGKATILGDNMIIDFVAYTSLFMATVFVIGLLMKGRLVTPKWPLTARLGYGLLYSISGELISLFHQKYFDHTLIDFSPVTVMLPAFFGGVVSALSSAVVTAVGRLLFPHYGMPFVEAGAFIVTALLCAAVAALFRNIVVRLVVIFIVLIPAGLLLYWLQFPLVPSIDQLLFFNLPLYIFVAWVGSHLIMAMRNFAADNQRLETYAFTDTLTGLGNYRRLRSELEKLMQPDMERICLVLTDCEDVRILNAKFGYHNINEKFRLTGSLLKELFPEALVISRYEGDKFALVFRAPANNSITERIQSTFKEKLPAATGLNYKYVQVFFPDDACNAEQLISLCEEKLSHLKKEYLLRREETTLWAEKMRVIGEMAAGMAHEIRNPLTAVKGFLQIAYQTNQLDKWYETMMAEVDRMNQLTVEFLNFSKPVKPNAKAEQLEETVRRAAHLLDSEAARGGHNVELVFPEEPVVVKMDKDKMLQVILNIMKNGLEAMEDYGKLTVSVLKEFIAGDGSGWGVVVITDNGKGISEEGLSKIFEPFYSTKEKGTGLGLPICLNIVHNHGGSIEISSKLGEGTTFYVRLPLAGEDQEDHNNKLREGA